MTACRKATLYLWSCACPLGLCFTSELANVEALLVYVSTLTWRGLYHVISSAALANRNHVFFTRPPIGVVQLHKSVNATILSSVRRRVFPIKYQAAVVRRWKVARGGVPSQGKYFKGGLAKCRLLWRSDGVFRAREGVGSRQRMRNSFSTLTFKKIKYLDILTKDIIFCLWHWREYQPWKVVYELDVWLGLSIERGVLVEDKKEKYMDKFVVGRNGVSTDGSCSFRGRELCTVY